MIGRRGQLDHAVGEMLTLQAKSIPVRKDDEVLIVRGKYKGREGKVTQVRLLLLLDSTLPTMLTDNSRSTERNGSSTSTESTLRSRTLPLSPSVSTPPTSSSLPSR